MKNKMTTKTEQNSIDIAVLKTKVDGVQDDVKTIMTNHLPHIQAKLDTIDKKLAYWTGGMAAIVSAVQILIKIFG